MLIDGITNEHTFKNNILLVKIMAQITHINAKIVPALFPLALVINLGLLLFLLVQNKNLGDLKIQNERERAIQQKLYSETPILEGKILSMEKERALLTADIKSLSDEKIAAQKMISESVVLSLQSDQQRQVAKNLASSIQAQQQTNAEQLMALTVLLKNNAIANAEEKEVQAKLSSLNQQIPGLEIKARSLSQAVQQREKDLASRNAELEVANAELKLTKQTLADRTSEIVGLNAHLAGVTKEKADWREVVRLIAEKAELAARISGLRDDLKSIDANLKELDQQKNNLIKSVSELTIEKNEQSKTISELATQRNNLIKAINELALKKTELVKNLNNAAKPIIK